MWTEFTDTLAASFPAVASTAQLVAANEMNCDFAARVAVVEEELQGPGCAFCTIQAPSSFCVASRY